MLQCVVCRPVLAVVAALVLSAVTIGQSLPTSPPARPRLLFTSADIPALQARINGGGVPGWAFSQLSGGASFQVASNQASWQVYRSVRFMLEAAVRWKLTGNTSARNSALNLLIRGYPNAIGYLVPTGGNKPYIEATYAGAIAMAFDLLHDELNTAERAAIVTELQSWVTAMYAGTAGPGGYYSYSGATDNQSFAWNTAIALSLLAIWGEPGVNNSSAVSGIDAALAKIEDGYRDAVSPDGSYDENSGYALYGPLSSLRAHVAAQNCGFPDRVTGTNARGLPSWFGRLLIGDSFHWTGDSSPTHRGVEFDPILYWIVKREADAEGLWFLERVRAVQNIEINTTTFAFSAFLSAFLHYPDALVGQAPEVMSGFYRDSLNVVPNGSPGWNKLNNNSAVGDGGSAWLHNTTDPSNENAFGIHYIIRDEWMNHSHEDDGHVDLVNNGVHHVLDRGYASPAGYPQAQSTQHNIVTVGGQDFLGNATNPFHPPSPEGRYLGSLEAKCLTPSFDYMRGDHRFMWMMERADRTVVLVKDPAEPFAIVLDRVRKTSGSHTYEQRWNTAGPMNGAGTPSNPVTITAGQQTMKAAWLAPAQVTIAQGAQETNAGITFHGNRALVSGVGDTPILSIWYGGGIQSFSPLSAPASNTYGGVVTWSADRVDKIIAAIDQNPATDSEHTLVGQLAWIRRDASGAIIEYAMGEGEQLLEGATPIVDSSEPITAVVRGGEIWITRAPGADPAVLPFITLLAPSTVSRVMLDGASVVFSQVAGQVAIGMPVPPPPPPPLPPLPPLTRDRFYTFTDGLTLDAVISGATEMRDGGLYARGNSVTVAPTAGQTYSAQPLWVGFDISGRGGHLGTLEFRTTGRFGDLVTADFFQGADGAVMAVSHSLLALPTVAEFSNYGGGATRVVVTLRPTLGNINFHNRFGHVLASGVCQVFTADTHITLHLSEGTTIDNLSIYDSEEDGIDPQGAAVWLHGDGRIGLALQSPQVMQAQLGFMVGGMQAPLWAMGIWLSVYPAPEIVSLNYMVPWPAYSSNPREVAFETLGIGAVPVIPGVPFGVAGMSASGVPFQAAAWY